MRITYIIHKEKTTTGLGGHYRSLKTLAYSMLRNNHQCQVVTLTEDKPSPVIDSMSCAKTTIYISLLIYHQSLARLRRTIFSFNSDVVHCFDFLSYFHAVNALIPYRFPTIQTKCGGPPWRRPYPIAKNLILFSPQDKRWFQSREEFAGSSLHLIPNRVSKVSCDKDLCDHVRNLAGEKRILLRICRIGPYYEKSIRSAALLVKELNIKGCCTKLVVIGAVESQETFCRLQREFCDDALFLTEDRFTLEGSKVLGAGDIIMGTGRGLMEAASIEKPLLVPVANSQFPVLVTPEASMNLFYYNFSPRSILSSLDGPKNLQAIFECLNDPEVYATHARNSLELFRRYFDVDGVVGTYLDIYNSAYPSSYNPKVHAQALLGIYYLMLRRVMPFST